ncbi:MAG TPA: hypothetical protein VFK89_04215 [Actinomycetota bacterium]|nr:hypothetical protein [Actinomycetota bacterium]
MARTNLHELATRLLRAIDDQSADGVFEGKLRTVATTAGLNSVRSAEAIKLLEELGRIEVMQRGRRGRDTIINIASTEAISLEDAEKMLPGRTARKQSRITYDEIGKAVVDRLIQLGRDDALRAAQVDAFEAEMRQSRLRVTELEGSLAEANERETDLRIKLRAAEDALERAEENLQKVFRQGVTRTEPPRAVDDDDARAVLDILRSSGS